MITKLKSRKLWAAVIGGVIATLGDQLGIPAESTQYVAAIVIGYILGQGAVDTAAALKR